MKKSEKMLLGVLGAAVTFFVLDTFVLSSDEEKAKLDSDKKITGLEKSEDNAEKSARPSKVSKVRPVRKKAASVIASSTFADWKRDPFLGSFDPALIDSLQNNLPYVLKAISWRGEEAHVIINDEVYKMGEPKDGFLVEGIRDDQVFCVKDGERFVLRLGE